VRRVEAQSRPGFPCWDPSFTLEHVFKGRRNFIRADAGLTLFPITHSTPEPIFDLSMPHHLSHRRVLALSFFLSYPIGTERPGPPCFRIEAFFGECRCLAGDFTPPAYLSILARNHDIRSCMERLSTSRRSIPDQPMRA